MIRAYHQPARLDEALELVANGATPLAGATALYTAKARRELALVDLSALGLGGITVESDRVILGAMATLTELIRAAIPGMEGALLRRAARAVTSHPLRNAITVGGNLAHVAYWADLPVVFLTLGASVEVKKHGSTPEVLPIEALVEPGKHPYAGGLITRVFVPLAPGIVGFGYERFSRTAGDYSLATSSVTLRMNDGLVSDPRVVLGAIQNRPVRATVVEQALAGRPFDDRTLAGAMKALAEDVHVAPNFRAGADYRRTLVVTLTRRALVTAHGWAIREA